MQVFFDILPEHQNTAVALGFFDGLHLGHRRVILLAADEKSRGLIPVCFTFSQSPKAVLEHCEPNCIITDDEKSKLLYKLGIEHIYEPDFIKVKDLPADEFFSDILIGKLKAKKIFCGFNYRFGKDGMGNAELLKKLCSENRIELKIVPPEKYNGELISSTLIRKLIKEGNISKANILLHRRFGFSSVINHGSEIGRTIGTPTINQPLPKKMILPKFGVYASSVTLENGKEYCGVTNIGIKPTVGGKVPLSETWMPEYSGDEIYGQNADIRLIEFIRPEQKFNTLEELKGVILENAETAVKIYNSNKMFPA